MKTVSEKVDIFRALHARSNAFVIPNPWDVGTAKLLEYLGFEALATTSFGQAFAAGKLDNDVEPESTLLHLSLIASATQVPVNADLGPGFGDSPESAAETIRRASRTGIAGGSIEDFSGNPQNPIYDLVLATERIQAAAEAAKSAEHGFVLTARAENYLHGRRNLSDTIFRLQAFQEAGADVLYAPGLSTAEEISAVISSVDRPVNVLAGMTGMALTVDDLAELGVRRISVGGSLCRAAIGAVLAAAEEMRGRGTFSFAQNAPKFAEFSAALKD
jgi:2-methylisocitrate lyase-like PEP mutase family enzyme